MSAFQIIIAILAAVALFLYGLTSFSREVQATGGPVLRAWLDRATRRWWSGFLLGASATLIVQSSSATTSLTVALVDAGAITLAHSLPVFLGAHLGTTATAWLVSFKLTGIGAFFIVAGAALGLLPVRWHVLGKPVFYFGLIFFALDLIGHAMAPLRQSGLLHYLLLLTATPWLALIAGAVATMIIQSSSATSGLAVVLVLEGVLTAEAAIPVVIGASVGTTTTALLASVPMSRVAWVAALTNAAFSVGGVVLIAPALPWFSAWAVAKTDSPAMAVALAHTTFNFGVAALFMGPSVWWGRHIDAHRRATEPGSGI
jgi:phosphate:Na+ symporter